MQEKDTPEFIKKPGEIFNKAKGRLIEVVDQNDDGEFDAADVSIVADAVGTAAKNVASAIKDSAEAKKKELELQLLQPIFVEDLNNTDFLMPKLVRIVEIDSKHKASEVCEGSIGYRSKEKDLDVVYIYPDSVSAFGLTFYPDEDSDVYYVDPSDRDHYIALDDYFGHLKVQRVNELQKIAQDLGATHFKVTFKEQKTIFTEKAVKAKAAAKVKNETADEKGHIKKDTETGDVGVDFDIKESSFSSAEIYAEMDCPGHSPQVPELHYLKNEPSIHSLIELRTDAHSPLKHQKYTLKLSNSSGIKVKDAVRIDAALTAMKLSGNTTVTSEAKNEARRFFEYEVFFD